MDNLGGIAVLVVIWIVGALFDKKKKEERRRRAARSDAPAPIEVESVSMPDRIDASQLEGSMLERVLRQIDPALADQAVGKRPTGPAIEPVLSPEPALTTRGARPAADDRAVKTQAAIDRRLEAAEARITGRAPSDHMDFHDSIRKPEKKEPAKVAFPVSDMRRAIVWREILGPPMADTIDEWW